MLAVLYAAIGAVLLARRLQPRHHDLVGVRIVPRPRHDLLRCHARCSSPTPRSRYDLDGIAVSSTRRRARAAYFLWVTFALSRMRRGLEQTPRHRAHPSDRGGCPVSAEAAPVAGHPGRRRQRRHPPTVRVRTARRVQRTPPQRDRGDRAARRRLRPDLVLLDVQMPDLDGWDTLRSIRASPLSARPARRALHGEVRTDDTAHRQVALGCDGYVVKPFSIGDLVAQVAAVLATPKIVRRARREATLPLRASAIP